MKRSFLHGLATCFVVGFFAGILLVLAGNQIAGLFLAFVCMFISTFLLRAAERAPVRNSTTLRVAGWAAAFAIALAVFGLIAVL
jgi:hypothetical protein